MRPDAKPSNWYTIIPSVILTKAHGMPIGHSRLVALLALATSLWAMPLSAEPSWYRCNTHTHTSAPPKSDANESPELIAAWYQAHGYQCLFITDHEHSTDVAPVNAKYADGSFLVIRGQEITQILDDAATAEGARQLHMNGLDIDRNIKPVGYPEHAKDTTALELYKRNMAEVRAAGGLPQLNHPNLAWSVSVADIPRTSQPLLLEVWNAAPASNNLGGADAEGHRSPPPEGLWDQLLTRGDLVWATASDDAHEYHQFDDHLTSTPGKAWIYVRADKLTAPAIMQALRAGNFYASTGVTLDAYAVEKTGLSLTISPRAVWTSKRKPNARFTTKF